MIKFKRFQQRIRFLQALHSIGGVRVEYHQTVTITRKCFVRGKPKNHNPQRRKERALRK